MNKSEKSEIQNYPKLNQIKLFLLPILRRVSDGPCTRWEDGGRPNIKSVEPLHHLHCFREEFPHLFLNEVDGLADLVKGKEGGRCG
jgi:hypothetical protein